MKKLALVVLAAAVSAGIALAGPGQRRALQQALVLRGPPSTSPLLGFRYGPRQTWLVRLDPKTLRARRGRRLALDSYSASWSYSPDRQLLALGNQTSAPITAVPARIRLVDVHTLHTLRVVPLGIDADVAYAHWVAPDRLIALVRSRDDEVARDQVVVVDPQTGAVEARQALDGHAICAARADHALVLVLEGAAYGPVRVVVAYDDGRLASVTLDQVQAGTRRTPDGVPRVDGAALAVDRQGGRAFVVAAGDPVAEVALDSLAVQYHTLAQPVSLLGRLHDWLEPRAQAKGPFEGSWRSAVWLGDGRLAVFGRDSSTYPAGDGLAVRERPSGLLVIDARSWASQTVDPGSSAIVVADRALLSWGWSWDSGTERLTGAGLNVYDQAGARLFHFFGRRVINDVAVVGSRAFVFRNGFENRHWYSVIDLHSGRQLRKVRGNTLPLVLTDTGPTFFG